MKKNKDYDLYENRAAIHRIIIIVMVICISTTNCIANEIKIIRNYDSNQIHTEDILSPEREHYKKVKVDGLYQSFEIGAPDIPVDYFRFLVPTYSKNFKISVTTKANPVVTELGKRISPIQNDIPINSEHITKFQAPIETLYKENNDIEAYILDDGFLYGSYHVVSICLRPISYSDKEYSLTAYSTIEVTLSFDEYDEKDFLDALPISTDHVNNCIDIANYVVNPENEAEYIYPTTQIIGIPSYSKYYYIIVPESLKNAVSDVANWKRHKGYTVIVKTIESICKTDKYKPGSCVELPDEAASLRAYLRDEFENTTGQPYYCLLVGDYRTSMPIRKVTSLASINTGNEEDVIPTDIYFSDLTSEWELSKPNGCPIYISKLKNMPYYPDIYVGRLLCTTKQEIDNWLKKLIVYEANPGFGDNEYLKNALFFEQWSWNSKTNRENSLVGNSKEIRSLLSDCYNCTLIQDPHRKDNNEHGITGAELIDQLQNYGLSSWHGHGNPVSVGCSWGGNYITSEDTICNIMYHFTQGFKDEKGNGIDCIKDNISPSVVYSVSCLNAPFDCYTDEEGYRFDMKHNIAAAFTTAFDVGGPLFLGNTRNGYIETSKILELKFFEGLIKNQIVGEAENYSKFNYNSSHLRATHNIIGDPEMRIWIGKPLESRALINAGVNNVSISGLSNRNTMISLYDGEGNVYNPLINSTTPSLNFNIPITQRFDRNSYAISIWEDGYLPVLQFYGQNAHLKNSQKNFIVRNALFGNNINKNKSIGNYVIGYETSFNLKAIDSVFLGDGFIVESGGTANFNCSGNVIIHGGSVNDGGALIINAGNTVIEKGFQVHKGGTLIIK